MITQGNREEFASLGFEEVKTRVANNIFYQNKMDQAREWLKENDPAWVSAQAAQGANKRATIALVISVVSISVAVATAWFK